MPPKTRSLDLELAVKPHNGSTRTYTDPETGISVSCQIELQRLPPGQTPTYDGKQLEIPEDFGWYWDHQNGVWVERIGGQRLLLKMAMTYKRFVAPVGRRFGKTTSIFFLLLAEGARTAGKYYALVVSPSHDKAYELMEHIIEMWGGPPGQKDEKGRLKPTVVTKVVGGPRDQRRYIETARLGDDSLPDVNQGCRIYFVSGGHPHYKRIRGYPHPMHRIIVDEFAQSHPDLWPVINPMLADADGRGLFIGTTDEKDIGNDLFHTFFLWGLDTSPKRANWGCMNFPTFANPTLNKAGMEEVENACVTEDDRLQEVYAKFLTGRGAVFQNLPAILQLPFITGDDLPQWVREIEAEGIATLGKANNTAARPPQVWLHADPKPDHTYVMSADWAKDRDHTIMSVLDVTTMKQVMLVRFYGQNWPEQYLWAYRLYERYRCAEFHGDENTGAGQAIGDFMRTEYSTGIYPHKFNVQNKGAYVHRAQRIFLQRKVKLINCYEQYEEIKSFKVFSPDAAKGQVLIRYGHPPGRNDDFVDAFLMLTETIARGKIEVVEDVPQVPKYGVKRGIMTLHTAALGGLEDESDFSGML